MCDCETKIEEKNSITDDNKGEKKTLRTSDKEKTLNARNKETVNERDSCISIYE